MALKVHSISKLKEDNVVVKHTIQEYQIKWTNERCMSSFTLSGYTDKKTYMVNKLLYSFLLYNFHPHDLISF